MKLILLTFLALSLFAKTEEKYPLIQPVSVEIAPVHAVKQALPTPKENRVVDTQKQIVIDSDLDGILDSADTCPDTPKNFIVDASGCPVQANLQINFDSNSYTVSEKYSSSLKDFSEFLLKNEEYQVLIYGFSDTLEDDKDGKNFSQKRANAIKEKLMQYGVSSTKLTAIGRGEENPVADKQSEEGREKNRRIEIELIP